MPDGVEKKPHSDILTIEELCAVSDALAELGVCKQRITGGEPLVRRGVLGFLEHIGANPLVTSLAVTTNGQLLSDMAKGLFSAGVNNLNVSIDTLDSAKYSALTKCGVLSKTLDGIQAAKSVGFSGIKVNAVLLRGVNDGEIYNLAQWARENGLILRFIELMPFSAQAKYAKQHFISSKEIIKLYDMQYLEDKSKAKKVSFYSFVDGVEAGFISPLSNKFCDECNRVRITADGKLLNCLHECREYDLRPYIGDKESLKQFITKCVLQKPKEHHMGEGVLQNRVMEDIGG
jgi:Molybdenum cofactor biosynthesis enzyme